MRVFSVAAALVLIVSSSAAAQTVPDPDFLSPMQVAIACAVPAEFAAPRPSMLRVVAAQDADGRRLIGNRDLVVIKGGTGAGLQLNQRFFVRRQNTTYIPTANGQHGIITSGWVRIVAVNDTTSIASVEYACADIFAGDYLDPFKAPDVPEGADRVDTTGEVDFGAGSRVLFGDEEKSTAGTGNFVLVERGSDEGLTPGARLAIYRDLHVADLPLLSIGEGVVVATSKATSVMRINSARDAVETGDLVFPRKP